MNKKVIIQRALRFIPGIILGLVLILLYQSMLQAPKEEIAQSSPFPEFSLADVRSPEKIVSLNDVKNQVSIVHVWATWCGVCVKEHHEWLDIKNKWPYDIVGVVYRDDADKVNHLMQEKGDPYQYLLNDTSGSLGLSLGLMGTPETFVVDKQGVIRFHAYGPMTVSKFEQEIVPVIEKINQENA